MIRLEFRRMFRRHLGVGLLLTLASTAAPEQPKSDPLIYSNRLTRITHPKPIFADFPDFVEPVREITRYEAPMLVDEPGADLQVRAWRFSYNARGIIEMPNQLHARETSEPLRISVNIYALSADESQRFRTLFGPLGTLPQCAGSWNSNATIPPTPVLSPGERKNRSPVLRQSAVPLCSESGITCLPLLWGEGWGEGKSSIRTR